ncbi:hypothetical protein Micbo1qcDRAFT_178653 [Microdochium bolleyi]|uniref:F-box domain-containing protein n=1 Tax=Microdochium bolleyi TaxID=196109 RepID=A0A136ISZ5_9PEZI|nr:hypothetical protein Micbo1qcDRAFT_178653 [Microdochium bolleyi]
MDWINAYYSKDFIVSLQATVEQSPHTLTRALTILIIHIPNLEHVSYGLFSSEQLTLLDILFHHRNARLRSSHSARVRRAGDGAMSTGPVPLLHLKKMSILNRQTGGFPLISPPSSVKFPVTQLQLQGIHDRIFSDSPGSNRHLRELEFVTSRFEVYTVKTIVRACPNLQSLSYQARIRHFFALIVPFPIDLSPVGAAIRQYSGNLTSLEIKLSAVPGQSYYIRDRIGSLCGLRSLQRLCIAAPLLIGAGDSRLRDILPDSIKTLTLYEGAWCGPVDLPSYERAVIALCREYQRFPDLEAVLLDWSTDNALGADGWVRGSSNDRGTWFTRDDLGHEMGPRSFRDEDAIMTPRPRTVQDDIEDDAHGIKMGRSPLIRI